MSQQPGMGTAPGSPQAVSPGKSPQFPNSPNSRIPPSSHGRDGAPGLLWPYRAAPKPTETPQPRTPDPKHIPAGRALGSSPAPRGSRGLMDLSGSLDLPLIFGSLGISRSHGFLDIRWISGSHGFLDLMDLWISWTSRDLWIPLISGYPMDFWMSWISGSLMDLMDFMDLSGSLDPMHLWISHGSLGTSWISHGSLPHGNISAQPPQRKSQRGKPGSPFPLDLGGSSGGLPLPQHPPAFQGAGKTWEKGLCLCLSTNPPKSRVCWV